MNDLSLYTTGDGLSQINLRGLAHTAWLTQLQMAGLFDATKQSISLHLKNGFEDGELDPAATVKESLTVRTDQIITSNGIPLLARAGPCRPVLARAGAINHEKIERRTSALYFDYYQRRKTQDALAADQAGEVDLQALENTIKQRPNK